MELRCQSSFSLWDSPDISGPEREYSSLLCPFTCVFKACVTFHLSGSLERILYVNNMALLLFDLLYNYTSGPQTMTVVQDPLSPAVLTSLTSENQKGDWSLTSSRTTHSSTPGLVEGTQG